MVRCVFFACNTYTHTRIYVWARAGSCTILYFLHQKHEGIYCFCGWSYLSSGPVCRIRGATMQDRDTKHRVQCAFTTWSPEARVGETILGSLQMGLVGEWGGLGGWCWVACSIWSMGSDSIRLSHLIRCGRPSWTKLQVQGMFFPGFRLSGAYFEILLQPMFWAYPGLAAELQGVQLRVRLSLLSGALPSWQFWNLGWSLVCQTLILQYLIVCLTYIFTWLWGI